MTVAEVTKADPLKAQMDGIKRKQQDLKVSKARVKAQQAQQQLRAAQTPAVP